MARQTELHVLALQYDVIKIASSLFLMSYTCFTIVCNHHKIYDQTNGISTSLLDLTLAKKVLHHQQVRSPIYDKQRLFSV